MAHFAELDGNNKVLRVCVVDNAYVPSDMHVDGETWCKNFWGGNWKQTSFNRKFRKNYATINDTYDEERDAFIGIKPYISWSLNEVTCEWEAPIPEPNDGKAYLWDEETTSWILYADESYE